jgi:hypothetical protein
MPDFYAFDVEEPTTPRETFEVFEEEPEEFLEVTEPDETLMVEEPERVPGSDAQFVQYTEDKPEKKETNWEGDKDPAKFIAYLKYKLTKIPRHSGERIPGCERAVSYLKALENESSKAMRSDYNGVIDEEELDKIRKDIETMIFRLENHIERLEKNAAQQRVRFISQGECKECKSMAPMWHDATTGESVCMNCERTEEGLEKQAGAATVNVYMTPWERAIIATCVNSVVSAGRNIDETFEHLDKKYKFSDREKLAFTQLLADHGYPVYTDRGRIGDKDAHPTDGEGIDFQTTYTA